LSPFFFWGKWRVKKCFITIIIIVVIGGGGGGV